jgi:hypothetical protein
VEDNKRAQRALQKVLVGREEPASYFVSVLPCDPTQFIPMSIHGNGAAVSDPNQPVIGFPSFSSLSPSDRATLP